MSMKLHLCRYAGCQCLTADTLCPKHRAMYEKKRRETAFRNATRFTNYSSPEWRVLRAEVIREHPYCQQCGEGHCKLQVHHVVPVRENPERFLDKSNLVVLCENCHRIITQQEIIGRRK